MRESPTVRLAERLIGRGYPIQIYDPNVYDKKLIGSNREFVLQHLPHFFSLLTVDLSNLIKKCDTVVVTQKINFPSDVLEFLSDKYVVDLVGWDELKGYCGEYEGICW